MLKELSHCGLILDKLKVLDERTRQSKIYKTTAIQCLFSLCPEQNIITE